MGRDDQRSFFWAVGCSLGIMTEAHAASAGFLLCLHVWMGFPERRVKDGRSPAIANDTGRVFFLMESIYYE